MACHGIDFACKIDTPVLAAGSFINYGAQPNFSGQVVTIKCFEDNSVLKTLVEESGLGRVIVMDGGGSLRRAILGDQLAEKAASNGWSGLIACEG